MLLLMDFTFIMSVTNEKEIKCWTISTSLILLANSAGSEPQITVNSAGSEHENLRMITNRVVKRGGHLIHYKIILVQDNLDSLQGTLTVIGYVALFTQLKQLLACNLDFF